MPGERTSVYLSTDLAAAVKASGQPPGAASPPVPPRPRLRLYAARPPPILLGALPAASVRTIFVAPGVVPPKVPANEGFESGAMTTTERGLADIVGRWLAQDNRLLIPLLSALIRSADSGSYQARRRRDS